MLWPTRRSGPSGIWRLVTPRAPLSEHANGLPLPMSAIDPRKPLAVTARIKPMMKHVTATASIVLRVASARVILHGVVCVNGGLCCGGAAPISACPGGLPLGACLVAGGEAICRTSHWLRYVADTSPRVSAITMNYIVTASARRNLLTAAMPFLAPPSGMRGAAGHVALTCRVPGQGCTDNTSVPARRGPRLPGLLAAPDAG